MRTTRLPLFLTLALPLLAGGCRREAKAPAAPPPVAVTTVTLKAGTVTLTRELPGRLTPFRVAEVRPQASGIVQKRLFTEGGIVEAGQPLYQLDDAAYRADFNRAQAALARAEAAQQLAKINADRSSELRKVEAVSQQEHENAMVALAQAEAEVGVARATLASAETILGYTRIVSPIHGRTGRSTVTEGALVTANQAAPLVTVQQLDPIHVDLSQSSVEWQQLRREFARGSLEQPSEMPVTLLLNDGSRYGHPGKLAFTEVMVDPATGSVGMRVVVPNPEHFLLPGMYVRAVIGVGVRQNAVLAPQQGIARDPRGNTTALVVGPDNKVELRSVVVDRTVGGDWLVNDGLKPGERIVVEGVQKARPGAVVNPTDAAATAATTPVQGAAAR
jgi:membrane fusion protein, multidrug efflux system